MYRSPDGVVHCLWRSTLALVWWYSLPCVQMNAHHVAAVILLCEDVWW